LPKFGIPETLLGTNPNELPFVLKKRLGVALALLAGKPWLILDEPTLGQDRQYRDKLAECIRLILAAGAGVILISHDSYFRSLFPNAISLLFENRTIVPTTK
jgi:ABC-type multidrug transport system ATPase subunit